MLISSKQYFTEISGIIFDQLSEYSGEPGWQLSLTTTTMYMISSSYTQGNWDPVLSKCCVKSKTDILHLTNFVAETTSFPPEYFLPFFLRNRILELFGYMAIWNKHCISKTYLEIVVVVWLRSSQWNERIFISCLFQEVSLIGMGVFFSFLLSQLNLE